MAAIGLESFLIPNGFLDGGVTGISLLLSFLTPLSFSLFLFILNIPFLILAKKQIGNKFALKSLFSIISLIILLELIKFPIMTDDKLLVAIFGGFFLGAGIGLCVRGGSVLDGTEILSVYLNKKTGFSIGEIVLFINVIIFSVAGILLGVEIGLYSMITYIIASRTIDFVSQGFEEYKSITIISNYSDKIKRILIHDLGKGVTIYPGERGNSLDDNKIDIIMSVVTRLEVFKIKKMVLEIDKDALIIEQNVHDLYGGILKKRRSQINK